MDIACDAAVCVWVGVGASRSEAVKSEKKQTRVETHVGKLALVEDAIVVGVRESEEPTKVAFEYWKRNVLKIWQLSVATEKLIE